MAGGLTNKREGGGAPVPMTKEDELKMKQAAAQTALKKTAPASSSTGGTMYAGGSSTYNERTAQPAATQTPAPTSATTATSATGTKTGGKSMTELIAAGVDPSKAMQMIMDDAQAINSSDRAAGKALPANTDPRPTVDESQVLTPELATKVKAAKAAIGAGDTKGAAQAVMEAGKVVSLPGQTIAPTQAVENVTAVAEGRNPVNTASPTGLWEGKVGMPTGMEPLDVIAETANPVQAQQAATQAQRAAQQAVNLGLATPKPVSLPGGLSENVPVKTISGPAPQPQPPAAGGGATQAPANPAAGIPGIDATTSYQPMSIDQLRGEAKSRAQLALSAQLDAIRQGLGRKVQGFTDAAKQIPQMLQEWWKQNDEVANRTGFFTSGRRFALRDKSMGEATRQLGQLESSKALAMQEAVDAEMGIARDQGFMENQLYGELTRDQRDYGLRERDMNSTLALRALDLTRGKEMLPLELDRARLGNQGAQIGNEQASFNLNRGQQLLPTELGMAQTGLQRAQNLLPYEVGMADVGLRRAENMLPLELTGAQLGNEAREIGNLQGTLGLDTALKSQPYQIDQAAEGLKSDRLKQAAAQLEYDIANDPNIGTRAQKTQELNLIRSQIAAQNALSSQRAQPTEPKETKPTAQSLAQRWGVSNPGLTTNYGAFDQQMGNWAYLVQQGGVEWQDVYDWLQENRQGFVTNGVDPSALEAALRTKFFPNTTE